MAKLATQRIVFQISKAVSNADHDNLGVLGDEEMAQLQEAIVALADDSGVIVELLEG